MRALSPPAGLQADLLRAVSALAVIKVNWDEDKDYIANFVPIVADCIRRGEHEKISLPEIKALVDEEFGLRIPQGALQTILARMARDGLIRRHHGVYERIPEALRQFDLGSEREDVVRQHNHLVGLLVDFAAGLGREWSEEQAERALLGYVEVLAEPILGAVVDGEPVVELPKIESEGAVVTSRFVLDLCHKEPQAFEYLVTVVKGTMLANVLFLPEAFSGGRARLTNIEVYLDTPVVLRALGYAEEQYREPVEEMVDLLVGEGAKLRIFEHTLHEVEGVLDGAAVTYRTGEQKDHFPGDIVDYFASKNLSRSDVEMEIAALPERLETHEIKVVDTPEHTEDIELSEKELEAALKDGVHYRRHGTMVKDLDSLTAIYRLRSGEARRHIESADALLVTTNTTVAHVSRIFFNKIFGHRSVPICMSDYSLAAIAWLMNPSQASDLPRRQIVAISFAALNPPEEVWRKYLNEIRRLQERGELSEEQVGLLLFSPDARLELMNATEGDAEALATGTIAEVLRRAERAARAEVEEKFKREQARREHSDSVAAAEKDRASAEAARAQRIAARHADHLDARADQLASVISWAAFGVAVLFLLAACAAAAQGLFPSSWSKLVPLGSGLVFLLAFSGVLNLATGWNLLVSRTWLAARLAPYLKEALRRWLSPATDENKG